MCRLIKLILIVLQPGLLLFFCECITVAAANPKPNILFILADDLGINDLACYGRKDHNTPNLDKLAKEGLRFTSAYCTLPICSPSRAGILTGKNPAVLHLTTFLPGRPDCASQKLLHPKINQQLPLEEKTIAEYLKEAGYISACIGKWHLGGKGFNPLEQGFDFYYPGKANTTPSKDEGGKGEYELTRTAIQFIETNRHRPFFVYLAHNSVHIPYTAKPELIAKNTNAFEPVYAALIETLDDTVGLLIKKLDELGLATNTLVIFTSDNGGLHVPEGGHKLITDNTPFRAGKGFLYEGGLRIPLIVRWSGHTPQNLVINEPVVNTDWLPTLLEIAGVKPPKGIDGISIAKTITAGKAPPANRKFYFHFPHYTNQGSKPAGCIREGRWKLIEHYEDGKLELYDLFTDISETNNLADKEPKIAQRLLKELQKWKNKAGVQTNSVNPSLNSSLHKQLYIDIDPSRFTPLNASSEIIEKMQEWRKLMNSALKTK